MLALSTAEGYDNMNLNDNVYNSGLSREDAKFKLWRKTGLLLTYKCNAACEFCYYCCTPAKGGLMPVETAVKAYKSLKNLAGDTAKVHLTGGEPFLYYERLVEILKAFQDEGLGEVDLVETNGGWANDEEVIVERLKRLDELGVRRFKISCDPFHQEYVGIEAARRLVKMAKEILGDKRVLVRWEKYLENPVEMKNISGEQLKQNYKQAIDDYPARFTGRAAGKLADMAADKSIDYIRGQKCCRDLLGAKGVHIDPYGNVFSGTCSGIVLGNVNETGLDEMWKEFQPGRNVFIKALFESGPAGLLDEAVELGYEVKERYAGKCHLCSDIRAFLLGKKIYPKTVGHSECYDL